MPHRLPSLLASAPVASEPVLLAGGNLFDGTGSVRQNVDLLIEAGRIARISDSGDGRPDGVPVIDVAGRTMMPGLIDVHAHLNPEMPERAPGTEPMWPGTSDHFVGAHLREALRMGVTTLRDVGSYGDVVVRLRQAMRYGAFRGPRVLTCGRIVSATAPGGRFFDGMYREADGPDEIRKAVREQLRRGADYIKVMATGARSVELEDPDPAQLTAAEVEALVDESHRMGYRVAAHAEGLAGTENAIRAGVDTIEHGMYLNRRPDLLDLMAEAGQILVPTFGCFYGVAGLGLSIADIDPTSPVAPLAPVTSPVAPLAPVTSPVAPLALTPLHTTLVANTRVWTPLLRDLARYNLQQADLTLKAAKAAGVQIAAGFDWDPIGGLSIEILRMIRHGLTVTEALVAATRTSAIAAGLQEHLGTIEIGKLADILIVDGDPVASPELLAHESNIWLVLQGGESVAGAALETDPKYRSTR